MAVVRITYDPNLTNANVSPTTQDTNSAGCLETLATPTPPQDADYTFVGWYTSQVDGTKITTSYVFNAAGTIYAHWTEGSENNRFVQYDEPQQLTSNQKQMARENIDAATEREEYISRFTGQEIDDAIGKVREYPSSPVTSVNGKTGTVVLKASDIENDEGYITEDNLAAEANARAIADNDLHLEIVEVTEAVEVGFATEATARASADNDLLLAINRMDLLKEEIFGTTQQINFNSAGQVSSIVHKKGSTTYRIDTFTYGTNTITEARTISAVGTLTIVTNLTTLVTTVTFTAA